MTASMAVGGTVILLRDGADGVEVLLIRRPDRGSFAGGWVFPGGVVEETDRAGDEQDTARRAALRECGEEVGLRPDRLMTLSCWVPPLEAPKRVRTWFFLAAAPGGDTVLAADEVVDARWMTPSAALAAHAEGSLALFPPTWVTLHALTGAADIAGAFAVASAPELFATCILPGGVFCWGGDAQHPEGGDGVHRLETAARPWAYRRD